MKGSRRLFERHSALVEGRLIGTEGILHGTVVNISPGGAGVLLSTSLTRLPHKPRLVIETADGTVTLSAHVVHYSPFFEGTYLGLEFEDLPHERSTKLLPIFAEFVLTLPEQSP